jgi:hypothetical protein
LPTLVAPTTVLAAKKGGTRNASVGGASVFGGNIDNAARVIAGLRAGLRDCYSRETSAGVGAIRFRLSVSSTGSVSNVSVASTGELSSGLVACTTARIRAAKFDPPDTGAATVQFPVTFTIQ